MDLKITEKNNKLKKRHIGLVLIILTIAVIFLILSTKGGNIQSETVKIGALSANLIASGTIEALNKRVISSQSYGLVEELLVKAGDMVTQTTVIASLANPQLKTELISAKTSFAVAKAEFTAKTLNLADEELTLKYTIGELKSNLVIINLKLTAQEELAKKGIISKLELAQVRAQQQQLVFKQDHSNKRLTAFKKNMQAQLDAEQARLDERAYLLESKTAEVISLQVTAGMNGVLQKFDLHLGQAINKGDEIAIVAKMRPLIAKVKVAQGTIQNVTVNMPVELFAAGEKIIGYVSLISPNVQNGFVELEVSLPDNLPKAIKTDLSVRASIELFHDNSALLLASRSYFKQGWNKLYIKKNDELAQLIEVEFGYINDGKVQILQGLNLKDNVLFIDPRDTDFKQIIKL